MNCIEFGVLVIDDDRIVVAVYPADQSRCQLSDDELQLAMSLLGQEAEPLFKNIWDCGSDANVVSRLHVAGSVRGQRPERVLRLLLNSGYLDFDCDDDEEE